MDGECPWSPDELGYVPLAQVLTNRAAGCPLPPGLVGFTVASRIVDKHGHELDGDTDPKGLGGCDHRDTPEWKAAHPRRKDSPPMPTVLAQAPIPESLPPEQPVALALNDAPPPALVESVGVDAAVGQVKSLVPEGTSPGLLIGGAATLAVIGAAIKFGPQLLKARADKAERDHELELERLKLEREKAERQESHQTCGAERAALAARLAAAQAQADAATEALTALKARLDEVAAKAERPAGAMPADFDVEALEARLARLERASKPAAKVAPKPRR